MDQGNMSFAWGKEAEVIANRKSYLQFIDLGVHDLVCMTTGNSTAVAWVDQQDLGKGVLELSGIKTEGLITRETNIALGLLTADCAPVCLWHPTLKIAALIHVGWQSLNEGVVQMALQEFINLGIKPNQINGYIGPSIDKQYLTDPSPKQLENPLWAGHCRKSGQTWSIDLVGCLLAELERLGVRRNYLEVSACDTYSHRDYYSHRAAKQGTKPNGRFWTIVRLKR